MGVAEVGLRRQLGVEVLVEGEFAAVVEGDRSAGGFRQWAEDLPEDVIGGLGRFVRQRAVNVKRVMNDPAACLITVMQYSRLSQPSHQAVRVGLHLRPPGSQGRRLPR